MSDLSSSWQVPDLPPFYRLLNAENFLPLFGVVVLFQLLALLIRQTLWNQFEVFNHPKIMFTDPVFYFEPWMKWVLFVTVGYFIHDTMDLIKFEISRWTFELLLHHLGTGFVMSIAISGELLTVYAYWALLMEINSIFLHMRSLLQLSGNRDLYPKTFDVIKLLNILTFVVFRFAVQVWQIHFVVVYREHFHFFYFACGFFGGLFFLVTNLLLFFRVLAADGFLGEFGRKHAAINRDEQKTKKHL
ncbi:TLC domain-containing protein [Aphelenchoides besseyi]|nr:TLC domain-containing protein [Aphelenchoides besseyi]KAI6208625.1 TLC domain-containing protein [Aphelenchoides besseyi]